MDFLGRVLRFLVWLLILSWAVKLLGRALGGSKQEPPSGGASTATSRQPEAYGKRLVKDPVCGMHLAEELALPASANGQTQFFCSDECRRKYQESVLRRAANA